jgi:hypothetical protein
LVGSASSARKSTGSLKSIDPRFQSIHTREICLRQQTSRNEAGGFVCKFSLTNAGPAVARDIVVRLVDWDEEAGRGLEDEIAREYVKAGMPVGGEVTIELRVPSRVSQKDLRLWAS